MVKNHKEKKPKTSSDDEKGEIKTEEGILNSRPQDVITTPKIKNRANKKYKPKEAEGTIESMDDNSDTEKKR